MPPLKDLTDGAHLAPIGEEAFWESEIIAVCDIPALQLGGCMAVMLHNGLIVPVPRDERYAVGEKVEVRHISFRKPNGLGYKMLYLVPIPSAIK